jgi:hypothetical protein
MSGQSAQCSKTNSSLRTKPTDVFETAQQNETGELYVLKYTKIPKVFFMKQQGQNISWVNKGITNSTTVSRALIISKSIVATMIQNYSCNRAIKSLKTDLGNVLSLHWSVKNA